MTSSRAISFRQVRTKMILLICFDMWAFSACKCYTFDYLKNNWWRVRYGIRTGAKSPYYGKHKLLLHIQAYLRYCVTPLNYGLYGEKLALTENAGYSACHDHRRIPARHCTFNLFSQHKYLGLLGESEMEWFHAVRISVAALWIITCLVQSSID
jgi:hypothetical protein